MKHLSAAVFLAAAFLFQPHASSALDYNYPSEKWLSSSTEHYNFIFRHEDIKNAAYYMTQAEIAYAKLGEFFRYSPERKTSIVLVDNTDYFNGFANPVDFNITLINGRINLYRIASEAELLGHESAHMFSMLNTGGFFGLLRGIFGTVIMPSALVPDFFLEGLAQYCSEQWDDMDGMQFRAFSTPQAFPSYAEILSTGEPPPHGTKYYNIGYAFIIQLVNDYGLDKLKELIIYNSRAVPLGFEYSFKKIYGVHPAEYYERWRKDRTANKTSAQDGEVFLPEGLKSVSSLNVDLNSGLYYFTGYGSPEWCRSLYAYERESGKLTEIDGYVDEYIDLGSDGTLLYTKTLFQDRDFELMSDLFQYDAKSREKKRLTRNMRCSYPSFAGRDSAVLTVNTPNGTSLRLIDLGTGTDKTILDAPANMRIMKASLSPENTSVVFCALYRGNWDIFLYEISPKNLFRLTSAAGRDIDPVFTSKAEFLYSSGTDSGFSICRANLAAGTVVRLTAPGPYSSPRQLKEGLISADLFTGEGQKAVLLSVVEMDTASLAKELINPAGETNPDISFRKYSSFRSMRMNYWYPLPPGLFTVLKDPLEKNTLGIYLAPGGEPYYEIAYTNRMMQPSYTITLSNLHYTDAVSGNNLISVMQELSFPLKRLRNTLESHNITLSHSMIRAGKGVPQTASAAYNYFRADISADAGYNPANLSYLSVQAGSYMINTPDERGSLLITSGTKLARMRSAFINLHLAAGGGYAKGAAQPFYSGEILPSFGEAFFSGTGLLRAKLELRSPLARVYKTAGPLLFRKLYFNLFTETAKIWKGAFDGRFYCCAGAGISLNFIFYYGIPGYANAVYSKSFAEANKDRLDLSITF